MARGPEVRQWLPPSLRAKAFAAKLLLPVLALLYGVSTAELIASPPQGRAAPRRAVIAFLLVVVAALTLKFLAIRATGAGGIKAIGLLLLASVNFAGYLALLWTLGSFAGKVYASFRFHGWAAPRRWRQTARLIRQARFGRQVRWKGSLLLPAGLVTLIPLALIFLLGVRNVGGISSLLLAMILHGALGYTEPPVILFLGTSSPRALQLLDQLRQTVSWRASALLETSAAPDALLERYLRLDDFRTTEVERWKDQVRELRDIALLTVLDTEATTEGVLFEVGLVFREQQIDSVLFVRDPAGRFPALCHALRTGDAPGDSAVYWTTPERVGDDAGLRIWHRLYPKRIPDIVSQAKVSALCVTA